MATVETVRGPIDNRELGRTLVHEHVFVMNEEYRINYQDDWVEQDKIADAVKDLNELKGLGIDTILDPTVLGIGRYVPRLMQIAAQTELNIVVATGMYVVNDLPLQFQFVGPGLLFDEPEPMTELFVKDLTEGIADTGVRAAFLKCAIDQPGLTPGVERVMRAVGQASVRTGAPVTVHTDAHSKSGLVAQQVLREEGVDLAKVVIGHSGDTTDLDYLTKLADGGSLLGMDRFGVDLFLPFEERVNTVVELVRRGYVEKIVVSHDAACFMDFFGDQAQNIANPKWNYRHISEDVIPALLERGLTEDEVEIILVENPRRYFG
ncbi:phosphotriesterase family protein [Streptomyces chartreusis]|uniref:Phosphotriesterase n=1 Tax=Streptomyces chartreusis TaxID=1969 RepID=A0A7I0NSH8_STRCX|nr:phosphotriesterase [Streptomyces chartreusis]QKZ16021.1 phosphotriesterase [Streptomyces chartreusis]